MAALPPTRSIFAALKWIDLPAQGEVKSGAFAAHWIGHAEALQKLHAYYGILEHVMNVETAMTVTISARAAKKIAEILAAEGKPVIVRLAVEGGGCSGFQYQFTLDESRGADDLLVEREGAKVLIDPISLDFLKGSEIDFADEMIGASFKVNNPNAKMSCGCGTSFSV